MTKTTLKTRWNWTADVSPLGGVYVIDADGRLYRIMRSVRENHFRIDEYDAVTWVAINSKRYRSPYSAARDVIAHHQKHLAKKQHDRVMSLLRQVGVA